MTEYWSWLGRNFKLTLGGRLAVTVFLTLGILAGAAGTVVAFYNVETGHDPDQVLGPQIAFSWIVAGILDAVLLGIVAGLDFAFRSARRRLASPS